ncbi:MAG TPA: hypothetical protein PK402_10190 [Tepidisphaeraceae bacterium]|nr:hypothetical protein [Tepidisphaeraceae bacterium]
MIQVERAIGFQFDQSDDRTNFQQSADGINPQSTILIKSWIKSIDTRTTGHLRQRFELNELIRLARHQSISLNNLRSLGIRVVQDDWFGSIENRRGIDVRSARG